jgi:hypothetical protein
MAGQSFDWFDFVTYRDSYLQEIIRPQRKRELLETFQTRYAEHHVYSARQAADWVDSDTNNLNANDIWDIFPRHGFLCLVQKIYDAQHENRLFFLPLLRWVDQWDGVPGLGPTAEELPATVSPPVRSLGPHQATATRRALTYLLPRIDAEEALDMKEAVLYSKIVGERSLTLVDPEITVEMWKLDRDEFDEKQPPSYDALRITGSITGKDVTIHNKETLEQRLRSVLNYFALAGCYDPRAASTEEAVAKQPHEQYPTPDQPEEETSDNSDEEDPYSPYVIDKTQMLQDSEPPEISYSEDGETISFTYQLGPTWTHWREDR